MDTKRLLGLLEAYMVRSIKAEENTDELRETIYKLQTEIMTLQQENGVLRNIIEGSSDYEGHHAKPMPPLGTIKKLWNL